MAELDRIVEVNISRGFAGIDARDFGLGLLIGRRADFKEDTLDAEKTANSVFTLRNLDDAKRYLE
ncbi:MAG: hypothetical protein LBH98_03125 [Chitinispirillales bacterium]|jgi:hypothetical protein|nr:hypothetical protein [Chitinispirillales bacterium]